MREVFFFLLLVSCLSVSSQDKNNWRSAIENAPHDSVRLRLCFQLSEKYDGRIKLAKFFALESVKYLEASPSPELSIKALHQAGFKCWEDADYKLSIPLHRRSFSIANAIQNHHWKGKALHFIGLNYYYTCDYDSALDYYKRAVIEYELAHDSLDLSNLENHTARLLDQIGDYVGATQHQLRALEMQLNMPGMTSSSHDFRSTSQLGDTLMFRARIEKGLNDLSYEREKKDSAKIAQILRTIANDYNYMGDHQSSLRFLKESAAYFEAADLPPIWGDFARLFVSMKVYDSALYYDHLWLKDQLEFGGRHAVAIGYSFKALIHSKMRNYDSALFYYDITLGMNTEMGHRIFMAENKLSIARILIEQKEFQKSLTFAQSALNIANEIKSIAKQADCYLLLTQIYTSLNRHQEALVSHEHYFKLDKQIAKGEAYQAVARLGLQYTINKREKEVKDLQHKNLLSESQIETRNLQVLLAIILIIIIASGGWFYFRSYKNKKRIADLLASQNEIIENKNATLEKQNREKETLIAEIHHRVKNNLQIISSLINLKAVKASNETSEVLYQLNGRIYSMGLIHERLYQKNEFQLISLNTYLTELGRYILDSFDKTDNSVQFKTNCEAIELDVDLALTCGLIMNELLTNSMKYAFTAEQEHREVKVELFRALNGFVLIIADNGTTHQATSENLNRNFGLRFVDQLVKSKLNGDWSIERKDGFQVQIRFPLVSNHG